MQICTVRNDIHATQIHTYSTLMPIILYSHVAKVWYVLSDNGQMILDFSMAPFIKTTLIENIITSYHTIDLKWQNRLKVGTDKAELKVNMQSVSDDDIRKMPS